MSRITDDLACRPNLKQPEIKRNFAVLFDSVDRNSLKYSFYQYVLLSSIELYGFKTCSRFKALWLKGSPKTEFVQKICTTGSFEHLTYPISCERQFFMDVE